MTTKVLMSLRAVDSGRRIAPQHASDDAPCLPLAVVIPVYNRAELLGDALDSVAAQSRCPAEVIVVDDCSDDVSGAVAEARGARVIRHQRNRGPSAARNTGLRATRQPWVAFLDCDDDWLPRHLQTLWAARDGHLLVAGSSLDWEPERELPTRVHGPLTRGPRVLDEPGPLLFPENFIVQSGVLVRRDAVLALGGYDETLRHSEDLQLWARLISRGSAVVLPEVTLRYRVHAQQAVSARGEMRESHLNVISGFGPDADPMLRRKIMSVFHWDQLREAQRSGARRDALSHWLWLCRPQRMLALFELLHFRYGSRRRACRFDREGRPSVAILGGDGHVDETLGSARVVDLRRSGMPRQLVALILRPPGRIIVGRRWQRRLLGLLGLKVA